MQENKYAIVGTPWLAFPLERAFAMQRMDRFMLNLGRHPEFARALVARIADLCKTLMGHFLDEIGGDIYIIKNCDDLWEQKSLLKLPQMYRGIFKTIHANYFSFIKYPSQAKFIFHSNSGVFPPHPAFLQ